MNKEIQIFKNEKLNQSLRTILNDDGTINYSLEDVAKAVKGKYIQYKNGKEYVRLANINNDLGKFGFPTLNGKDEFIPESAVYLLIMNGENELAVEFQKWLAVDVIPQIRRTGSYQSQQKAIEGINHIIDDMQGTIEEYKSMCKITCSKKRNYTDYIKKALGVSKANSEFERVKARIFLVLGVTKWEDIDFETSKNILSVIDESIRVAKSERPYKQMSYFD